MCTLERGLLGSALITSGGWLMSSDDSSESNLTSWFRMGTSLFTIATGTVVLLGALAGGRGGRCPVQRRRRCPCRCKECKCNSRPCPGTMQFSSSNKRRRCQAPVEAEAGAPGSDDTAAPRSLLGGDCCLSTESSFANSTVLSSMSEHSIPALNLKQQEQGVLSMMDSQLPSLASSTASDVAQY